MSALPATVHAKRAPFTLIAIQTPIMQKAKQSWKHSDKVKQEVRDFLEAGLMPTAISRITGLPLYTVRYIKDPDAQKARRDRYYAKNRKRILAGMRKYNQKRKRLLK